MPKTLRNATAGDEAQVGYRDILSPSRFMGFGFCHNAPASPEELHPNSQSLFAHLGVQSFREADEKGHEIKAWFRDLDGDFIWAAYRFRGAWCVGTSADRLKIR